MQNRPSHIIVHCSDSAHGNAAEIDRWHRARGWARIGYHFVICNGRPTLGVYSAATDGLVEPGRAPTEIGAHTAAYNARSLGVCLVGKDGTFTQSQIVRAVGLVADLCLEHKIPVENVLGHCEADPAGRSPAPASNREGTLGCPTLPMPAFRADVARHILRLTCEAPNG